MSAWTQIEADLRRAMVRIGKYQHEITATLEALRPIVAAVERAGTKVDAELAWAMLAVAADRRRRLAHAARTARAS